MEFVWKSEQIRLQNCNSKAGLFTFEWKLRFLVYFVMPIAFRVLSTVKVNSKSCKWGMKWSGDISSCELKGTEREKRVKAPTNCARFSRTRNDTTKVGQLFAFIFHSMRTLICASFAASMGEDSSDQVVLPNRNCFVYSIAREWKLFSITWPPERSRMPWEKCAKQWNSAWVGNSEKNLEFSGN